MALEPWKGARFPRATSEEEEDCSTPWSVCTYWQAGNEEGGCFWGLLSLRKRILWNHTFLGLSWLELICLCLLQAAFFSSGSFKATWLISEMLKLIFKKKPKPKPKNNPPQKKPNQNKPCPPSFVKNLCTVCCCLPLFKKKKILQLDCLNMQPCSEGLTLFSIIPTK